MNSVEINILELLSSRGGEGKSFVRANLKGKNLQNTRLSGADLTEADLLGADLRGAILTNANLTRAQVIGADFTGATLTGACLENWNLSHTTKLAKVHCQYVYLLNQQRERRPNSGEFADGGFASYFQAPFDSTVDFIFRGYSFAGG